MIRISKNNNPSLKSCLLRIPGSLNSKYNNKVIIVQKWNGYIHSISEELLEDFRTHLLQTRLMSVVMNKKYRRKEDILILIILIIIIIITLYPE